MARARIFLEIVHPKRTGDPSGYSLGGLPGVLAPRMQIRGFGGPWGMPGAFYGFCQPRGHLGLDFGSSSGFGQILAK